MSDEQAGESRSDRAIREYLEAEEEREAIKAAKAAKVARATAGASSAGTPSAAPGWYPDPEMAQTRRYWNGSAWTDHRAPAETIRVSRNTPAAVRRIGWAVGFLFLIPVAFITFDEPSYGGEACGTWITPTFTDTEIAIRRSDIAIKGGGYVQEARLAAIASNCNESLATRRLIALILLGLGVGARIGIPLAANAMRD